MSRYSAQQSSISENNSFPHPAIPVPQRHLLTRADRQSHRSSHPAAITKITAKLTVRRDVIEETGDMDGDKNRRSIGLNLNCAKYHVVGVKFARSLVQIAVFDLKCNRIFPSPTCPPSDEEHIPETVEQHPGHRTPAHRGRPEHRGRRHGGSGARIWWRSGTHRRASHPCRAGGRSTSSRSSANAFSVPVFVERDARAGALGAVPVQPGTVGGFARLLSAWRGHRPRQSSTTAPIYYGAHGTATEIGHVSVDVNGKPCDCGNVGCRERYCSANAIHERLNANSRADRTSRMRGDDARAGLRRAVRQG